MKRILGTMLLAGLLVFSFAAIAMAGGSFYAEGLIHSQWELKDDSSGLEDDASEGDLSGSVLGVKLASDRFLLGLEYLDRTTKNPVDGDANFETVYIKGGLILFGDDQNHLAVTVGYNRQSDDVQKMDGVIWGMDWTTNLSDKTLLEASAGYSDSTVWKAVDEEDDDELDVKVLLLNVRYTCFLTNQLGVSLGYRFDEYTIDSLGDPKIRYAGPTAGLTYRF